MICVVEVRTFAVTHFYGSLHLYDDEGEEREKSHTLTYKLGVLQARAMNKAQGIVPGQAFLWEPGAECNAFFTEQAVLDAAKEAWRRVFPKAKKLVRGKRHLAGYDLIEVLA